MHRLNFVANPAPLRLLGIAGRLYGSPYRRTTFPFTPRSTPCRGAAARAETYVVCLDCGPHFAYDCSRMRLARQRPASVDPGVSARTGRIS